MNLRWVGFLLTVLLGLSGCTGKESQQADASATSASPSPPTDETGNIAVTIADEEMVPLPSVDVGLREVQRTGKTDADGLFIFDKLEAGPYSLDAQRLGYESVSRTVQVIAGETTDITIILAAIQVAEPSMNVTTIQGLMGCAAPKGYYPCIFQVEGIDQSLHDGVEVGKDAGGVVLDVYWEPNAGGLPANMEIRVYPAGDCDQEVARASGPSPLQLVLPLANFTEEGKAFKFCIEMYAGDMDAAVQQEYQIDVSSFYHQGIPAGYRSRS